MKRPKKNPTPDAHPGLVLPPTKPILFDIHQLAKALNVGRTTVEKWTRSRRIPSLKLGRVLRYDLKRVMAALEAYERKAL